MFVTLFAVTFSINSQDLDFDGKVFKIQSADPNSKGKFIDADGHTLGKDGTKIQLWDGNDEAHQNWKFVRFSYMGAKNIYFIVNMSSNAGEYNYLTPSTENIGKNGVEIGLSKKGQKPSDKSFNSRVNSFVRQVWKVTKNDDNTYRIEAALKYYEGVILDADGYTQGNNGGGVHLWEPLNNPNQGWNLIPLMKVKRYKIGDKHPDGGIVVSVDSEGTSGTMMWLDNEQKFSFDEAKAKAIEFGNGWRLPSKSQLKKYETNLHRKSTFQFTDFYYWTGELNKEGFAYYVRFSDGYAHYGPIGNKFNICLVKNF